MRGLNKFGLALIYSSFIPFALGYTFTKNLTAQGVNGAVSCENKVCSQAGASMLQKGGNAADAVSELNSNFTRSNLTINVDGCHSSLRGGYWYGLDKIRVYPRAI
jgi:hypothetical protein